MLDVLDRRDGAPRSASARYRSLTTPRADGLPRLTVLLAFPAALVLIAAVLIGLGVNGSSSGVLYSEVFDGRDPALIAGEPRPIRSDEWNVGTAWTIAQVEQGLPTVNRTFPGGMDAALPYDLPRADWTVAFRPHLIGYLVLDLDHATAWRWWVPGLALIAAAYVFTVTLVPRRPLVAALVSVAFFFSPFFQWWYQPTTFWPAVWALVTAAGMVWSISSGSTVARTVWASLAGYLTVVLAMGIYAPFIVPAVLVVAIFAIGTVVNALHRGIAWRALALRLAPILVAGIVGIAVTAAWLASRRSAVDSFLGTVYPGQRLTPTGSADLLSMVRTVGSPFTESLVNSDGFLGTNSSESATFFLVGVWLIPVLVWLSVRRRRAGRALPWTAITLTAGVGLVAAFAVVPGWNAVAHLLFLDLSTPDRTRIGLGIVSLMLLVVVIRELDLESERLPRSAAVVTAVVFGVSQSLLALVVLGVLGPGRLLHDAPFSWLFALGSMASLYLFARRRIVAAAAVFAGVGIVSAAGVNPLYYGVLDLRDTAVADEIREADGDAPGAWIGVGDRLVSSLLLQSGVEAYNGTQGAPSTRMWQNVDPDGEYEQMWNRIGAVVWIEGEGDPQIDNPAPDVIRSTFDACAPFAQEHVRHVLSDIPLTGACLEELERVEIESGRLTIYGVVEG